jgi:hypothetical protein
MSRDFKKIRAWQAEDDLTFAIYQTTGNFPKHELCGLTSQIRRSSSSVPANIAEGASGLQKRVSAIPEHSQRFYCRNGVFPPFGKTA